eukprot:scaffold90769_cov60-Phaeocystis_antarctica.AAC.1
MIAPGRGPTPGPQGSTGARSSEALRAGAPPRAGGCASVPPSRTPPAWLAPRQTSGGSGRAAAAAAPRRRGTPCRSGCGAAGRGPSGWSRL